MHRIVKPPRDGVISVVETAVVVRTRAQITPDGRLRSWSGSEATYASERIAWLRQPRLARWPHGREFRGLSSRAPDATATLVHDHVPQVVY